jgi:hypothetical protein
MTEVAVYPIKLVGMATVLLTVEQIEALHLETEAALRQIDDERAHELHTMQEDESIDSDQD